MLLGFFSLIVFHYVLLIDLIWMDRDFSSSHSECSEWDSIEMTGVSGGVVKKEEKQGFSSFFINWSYTFVISIISKIEDFRDGEI